MEEDDQELKEEIDEAEEKLEYLKSKRGTKKYIGKKVKSIEMSNKLFKITFSDDSWIEINPSICTNCSGMFSEPTPLSIKEGED